MSLQIIAVPAHTEDVRQEEAVYSSSNIPAPPLIPPAPPLPACGLPVVKAWRSQDLDSGCGSFGDKSYFDDLPGCHSSDDEFSKSFVGSQPSLRRSSRAEYHYCLTIGAIPHPPPPPPVQFFLPRFVGNEDLHISVPRRNLFRRSISLDSDVSSLRFDSPDFLSTHDILATCIVCYDDTNSAFKRLCCQQVVCQTCLGRIIHTRLNDGLIEFPCPNPECSAPIGRTEVLHHLNREEKTRFERLRVNAESDGNKKTCPHCSHITEHELPARRIRHLREEEVKIQCENCRIEWCFKCHAPWHQDMTCKEFIRGNRQFREWTKDRPNGVANCQKCPTCRVFIQRSTGCDHMTCNRCNTHFCYKCGGHFVDIPGLGDHYKKMSMFGCRYNYLANEPAKRKAIRGGYFGAKMAMLTGYPVLFVAGVAVFVVIGAVALPIYGGYRLYKFKKNTNKMRRRYRI